MVLADGEEEEEDEGRLAIEPEVKEMGIRNSIQGTLENKKMTDDQRVATGTK